MTSNHLIIIIIILLMVLLWHEIALINAKKQIKLLKKQIKLNFKNAREMHLVTKRLNGKNEVICEAIYHEINKDVRKQKKQYLIYKHGFYKLNNSENMEIK